MSDRIRIAMGQMLVEGAQPAANLRRAADMIQLASEQDADVIVLPECIDIGWTHPAAASLAQPIPGLHSEHLAEFARGYRIHVVAGLVEQSNGRLFNSAVLIDPDGRLLLHHRKINELEIAHDLYSLGDRIGVAETSFGVVAVNICADNFPDSLAIAHVQARMGARLLLSPCAWAVDAGHDNEAAPYGHVWKTSYRELARLYGMTVVGVSNVGQLAAGPWKGKKCIGCSMAVGADGRMLAQAPYGESAESLVQVDVELTNLNGWGTRFAEHLRERGYIGP